ncbi:MAG TPA: Gfo/Idh/MocA family oxidoreductase, partial [Bryobacteraceae bacterium]|nr:Gfo/Idh/MocA family oxidoreductase [Bryobacteraceae bacterium]
MTMRSADTDSTRRTFLERAAALTAAGVLAGGQAKAAPSDRIRVGFIGLGVQGTGRLGEFMRHPDVFAAAVCDVDQTHLDNASALVEKSQGHKPDAYGDFRKVIERNDIDAVMIATPDHWHALPAVTACQAGKDVFVEKPMAYSIGEGRAMANAATRHKRVTQLGNHIHNDLPNYRRSVEIVRSGILGKINRVFCA